MEHKKKNVYALYKGDELLEIGTAEEIAKKQNTAEDTIRYYGSTAHLRKRRKSKDYNYKILIKIGATDDKLE